MPSIFKLRADITQTQKSTGKQSPFESRLLFPTEVTTQYIKTSKFSAKPVSVLSAKVVLHIVSLLACIHYTRYHITTSWPYNLEHTTSWCRYFCNDNTLKHYLKTHHLTHLSKPTIVLPACVTASTSDSAGTDDFMCQINVCITIIIIMIIIIGI